MKRLRFAAIVKRALDGLPEWIRPHLDTIEVVIEDRPPPELLEELDMDPDEETLFGYYDGVPLTDRLEHSDGSPTPVMPTISIYQRPLEEEFPDEEELTEQIRVTVVHEIGHHLGLEEDRIEELGYG